MIIEKWENGDEGMRYYIKQGASSCWKYGKTIENKKYLTDYWRNFFGKEGNKISDIYIDKENDSVLNIRCNKVDEEIVLKNDEMDKDRLIDFLRKIPPTAEFELDEQLVHVTSKISDSKIKIAWMRKCHRNTVASFIKFLSSSEAQLQIKQRTGKPILSSNMADNACSARRINFNPRKGLKTGKFANPLPKFGDVSLSNKNSLKRVRSSSNDDQYRRKIKEKKQTRPESKRKAEAAFTGLQNKVDLNSSNYIICGLVSQTQAAYSCIVIVSTNKGRVHIPLEISTNKFNELHPKNQAILRKLQKKYDNRPVYSQLLIQNSLLCS